MKKLKLLTLVVALLLLITGCTPASQGNTEAPKAAPIIANPTTTYLPRPLNPESNEEEKQSACAVVEQTNAESELNTLLPLIDCNFDEATDVSDTKWTRIGNSVVMSIDDEGFYGNCLKFTKDGTWQIPEKATSDMVLYVYR